MSAQEASEPFNARMHEGGKLSFRARLPEGEVDTGDRLVHGGKDPPPLEDLVPAAFLRAGAAEVEIGPGKGAFVLASTQARPDTFVLGIEAAPGYAAHAAARLAAAGATNGLLLIDNGKLYLQDRVPTASLAAVHVYFPDPWPKRRHAGRRFFTDDVPAVLARVLQDGGHLFVATDNPAYAGQVARVMGSAADFCCDEAERARRLELGAGHAFSPTNFERKYIEQGRAIRRWAFRRLRRS
ncbi:MAG: tRNA (guanosine(46)-N(7))-methyltransferase TrmB [Planctomycetota bacterium]